MISVTTKYKQTPKINSAIRRWIEYRKRLRFEVFQRDSFTCQYCGWTVSDGAKLEIDHITPKSKGGEFVAENLLTSCHECNHGKADILLRPSELEVIVGSKQ